MFVCYGVGFFFFFKQKTAYEMRISDWSSDVCSSDLFFEHARPHRAAIAVDAIVAPVVGKGVQQALRVLARADDLCVMRARGSGHDPGADEIGRASCRERVCQ